MPLRDQHSLGIQLLSVAWECVWFRGRLRKQCEALKKALTAAKPVEQPGRHTDDALTGIHLSGEGH